jgi:hypothetical protein
MSYNISKQHMGFERTASMPCQLNVIASFAPAGIPASSSIITLAILSADFNENTHCSGS